MAWSKNGRDPRVRILSTPRDFESWDFGHRPCWNHLSSVQNSSLIPLYWFAYRDPSIGLFQSISIPNILGSIIHYNHQPTEVLNTAHLKPWNLTSFDPVWPSHWRHPKRCSVAWSVALHMPWPMTCRRPWHCCGWWHPRKCAILSQVQTIPNHICIKCWRAGRWKIWKPKLRDAIWMRQTLHTLRKLCLKLIHLEVQIHFLCYTFGTACGWHHEMLWISAVLLPSLPTEMLFSSGRWRNWSWWCRGWPAQED